MNVPSNRFTAVAYARVSTDDKDQDPMTQIRNIREYCAREDIELVGEYIEERSAKDMDRPKLQEMLGRIMTDRITMVLAWNESRLSRDMSDMDRLVQICNSAGTVIRYVANAGVNPETSAGKLLNTIGTWQSEEERKKLALNTKQGMATAKLKGKHVGRMLAFCFTERVAEHRAMIQTDAEKHPTVIASIHDTMELSRQGYTVSYVANNFYHVSPKTLRNALASEGLLDEYNRNVETARGRGEQGGTGTRVPPMTENTETRGVANE